MHISPVLVTRRTCHRWSAGATAALLLGSWQQAQALSLAQLSTTDANNGIKLALSKGAEAAVALLGRPDGFLGNPRVRIPLPGYLDDAAKLMKRFGQASASPNSRRPSTARPKPPCPWARTCWSMRCSP